MTVNKTLLVLPAAAAMLVALTGCGGGTPPAPPTLADCMLGDWASDAQDIADQVIGELNVAGLGVTSATGTGTETAKITRANLTMTDDLELTFELPDETIVQDQVGSVSSEW